MDAQVHQTTTEAPTAQVPRCKTPLATSAREREGDIGVGSIDSISAESIVGRNCPHEIFGIPFDRLDHEASIWRPATK